MLRECFRLRILFDICLDFAFPREGLVGWDYIFIIPTPAAFRDVEKSTWVGAGEDEIEE